MQKITRYLIYITVFLLPAYLVRLPVFGVSTNILEILMFLTIIAYLAEYKYSSSEFYRNHKAIVWAVVAIFAGLTISTLINHNYAASFGIIKGWFVLPMAFAWVVYADTKSAKDVESIYKWLYLSTFWVAVAGLFYYFTGQLTYDGRLQGIFNSPNYLAMYLSPAIIIGLWSAQVQSSKFKVQSLNSKLKIILFAVSLVLILLAFYFTYSYAAWMAILASILATYFIKNKKINWRPMVVASLILLAIFVSQRNTEKFQNLEKYTRSSVESRKIIWESATKILGDNIIFGIGPGNFQDKYLEYQKYYPPYLEWAVPHPHNLYLAFWLYGGVLGFAGFITALIFWFKEILKKEKDALWLASFGIMLYFLLHGLADTTYFKNDLAVVFWLNFMLLL